MKLQSFSFVLFSCFVAAISGLMARADEITYDREIRVGVSSNFKGKSGATPIEYIAGARAAFDLANKNKTLKNKRFSLIVSENEFETKTAVEDTKKLVEIDNVHLLFGYYGSQIVQAVTSYIEKTHIPFLFPSASLNAKNVSEGWPIFSLKPSNIDQVNLLTELMVEKLEIKDIGLLHQYDAFGIPGRTATLNYLKSKNISLRADLKYTRDASTEVIQAAKQMAALHPKGVLLIATAKHLAEFVKQCLILGYKPTFFATARFPAGEMKEILKTLSEANAKIYIAEAVPRLDDTSLALIKSFKSAIADVPGDHVNSSALEGFIAAKIVIHAIELSGDNLSAAFLIKSLEKMQDFDLDGVKVSLSAHDHQALKKLYLTNNEGTNLVPIPTKE